MICNLFLAGDVSNLGFLLGLKQAEGVDAVNTTGSTVSLIRYIE